MSEEQTNTCDFDVMARMETTTDRSEFLDGVRHSALFIEWGQQSRSAPSELANIDWGVLADVVLQCIEFHDRAKASVAAQLRENEEVVERLKSSDLSNEALDQIATIIKGSKQDG